MKRPNEDDDLTSMFDELRRDDHAQVPPFQRVRARTLEQATRSRLRPLALITSTALLSAALLWGYRAQKASAPDLELVRFTAWSGPTDFLLRTPRSRVLVHVPSLEFSLERDPR